MFQKKNPLASPCLSFNLVFARIVHRLSEYSLISAYSPSESVSSLNDTIFFVDVVCVRFSSELISTIERTTFWFSSYWSAACLFPWDDLLVSSFL